MNWKKVGENLDAIAWEKVVAVKGGRVLRPPMPINPLALLAGAAGSQEEQDDWEADKELAYEALESRGEPAAVLWLDWENSMCSSSLHVGVLNWGALGTFGMIGASDGVMGSADGITEDLVKWAIVARFVPRPLSPLVSAFIGRLIATNGKAFGTELMGSLPAITNCRPYVVRRKVVQDAFWKCLQIVGNLGDAAEWPLDDDGDQNDETDQEWGVEQPVVVRRDGGEVPAVHSDDLQPGRSR